MIRRAVVLGGLALVLTAPAETRAITPQKPGVDRAIVYIYTSGEWYGESTVHVAGKKLVLKRDSRTGLCQWTSVVVEPGVHSIIVELGRASPVASSFYIAEGVVSTFRIRVHSFLSSIHSKIDRAPADVAFSDTAYGMGSCERW